MRTKDGGATSKWRDGVARRVALREPFNAVSHIVGGGLSILAAAVLLLRAHGPLATAATAVYAATLVAVFTMSALYHSVTHAGAGRWLFRLDQSAIYLLIAGTYTPVALVLVGGAWGWGLALGEWALAAIGVTLLLTVHRTPQWIHQAAYIVLGWAAVIALPRLLASPWGGLALLMGGGIVYTLGSLLYNRDRKGTLGLGDHELWHLLVLLGAGLHVAFVLAFVLP